MTKHLNDVTVGPFVDGTVTVKMYGPLSEHILGLRRKVVRAEGVKDAMVVEGEAMLVLAVELIGPRDTHEQIRIRVRNRCRDYYMDTTGYMSNTGGEQGSYADLIEQTDLVAV
ncbi:MAG: hypothetical protein WAQ27_04095 [Candidatus Microsaccharimonas sp.]